MMIRVCGEGTQFMHSCRLKTIDPRIPTMRGRTTSDFHRPSRHRVGGGACTQLQFGGEGLSLCGAWCYHVSLGLTDTCSALRNMNAKPDEHSHGL